MLVQLSISNFAIIDELEVTFRPGLNIISGETGAGKSIIINAVNLMLGGRASTDLIRTGETEARVEALFQVKDNSSLNALLQEMDIPYFGGELLIKRIVSKEGRGRSSINGSMVNLQSLSRIGAMLISISGQHEHQMLLKPENHLYILDEFAGAERDRYNFLSTYREYQEIKNRIMELEAKITRLKDEQELIRFKINEIDSSNLKEDEDIRLEEERRRLKYGAKLMEIVSGAYNEIYENEGSILSKLGTCIRELDKGIDIEKRLSHIVEALESVKIELQERALELRDILQSLEINPDRLQEIEDRIYHINSLKKKYGGSIKEIMRYRQSLEDSIDELESEKANLRKLKERIKGVEKVMLSKALSLSKKRKDAGKSFEKRMEQELALLDMKKTRFRVTFSREVSEPSPEDLSEDGIDRVEFMISPNLGEELRPLFRIASGGELSRILLALKTIMGKGTSVETLIFDEVDSGIGGATADVIGEKLKSLSKHHQIICITHLPQIASKGDAHFRVIKRTHGSRTITTISELNTEDRIKELARMLGGRVITERAMEHAKEMLNQSFNLTT